MERRNLSDATVLREQRARYRAKLRGWAVRKSRRRFAKAHDYGLYRVVDAETGAAVRGGGLSLEELERTLEGDDA